MLSLQNHQWLANIGELLNVILRSMLLAEGGILELNNLPDKILNAPKQNGMNDNIKTETNVESFNLEKAESEHGVSLSKDKIVPFKEIGKIVLQNALEITNGNATYAAK